MLPEVAVLAIGQRIKKSDEIPGPECGRSTDGVCVFLKTTDFSQAVAD
jgi:hypothetical protein